MGEDLIENKIYAAVLFGSDLQGNDLYKFEPLKQIGNATFVKATPEFKRGDFVYEDGRIMIAKNHPNNYYALIYPKLDMKPIYNGRYAPTMYLSPLSFRYATEDEKQLLIDAMGKDGKRWNAEKLTVEDITQHKFKDGDFLHSDWGNENITIIYRNGNGDGNKLYYHVSKSNSIGLSFKKDGFWSDYGDFRLATESEKKELIDALAEVGKRWNAEKKCIEDIPNRKFKVGDKVMIKDGISSKTHGYDPPCFSSKMDEFIGKELTVEGHRNGFVLLNEDYYKCFFHEDWLEPCSEEPKKGDLAICWDRDKSNAMIRFYDRKHSNWHYDTSNILWLNAIKFESKEQYEKVLRGEI